MGKIWIIATIFTIYKVLALPQPLDSIDDARNLLGTLVQLTTGYIAVAQIQIEDIAFDLSAYGQNIYLGGQVSIQINSLNYQDQLAQIKQFAAENQKNISSCLDGTEYEFSQLPIKYLASLDTCIKGISLRAEQIQTAASYRVDIIMMHVNSYDFAIAQCGTSNDTCIAIVSENIKVLTLNIESLVQVEVEQYTEDADIMRGDVDSCANDNVSGFSSSSITIINQIAECAA